MAVSLSFGVIFATAITLFIVPVGYLILEKYILKTEKVIMKVAIMEGPDMLVLMFVMN